MYSPSLLVTFAPPITAFRGVPRSHACGMHARPATRFDMRWLILLVVLESTARGAAREFSHQPGRRSVGRIPSSSKSFDSRRLPAHLTMRGGATLELDAAAAVAAAGVPLGLQLVLCRRLCLASFLGMLIGIERGWGGKPAGVRTMSLVAMGSCAYMFTHVHSRTNVHTAPARLRSHRAYPHERPACAHAPRSRSTTLPHTTQGLFCGIGKLGSGMGDGSRIAAQVTN